MQPYSDRFRTYRKVIHQVIGSKATAARFNPLQEVEIRRFLLRVLDRPNDLVQHIRTYDSFPFSCSCYSSRSCVLFLRTVGSGELLLTGHQRSGSGDPENRIRVYDRATRTRSAC